MLAAVFGAGFAFDMCVSRDLSTSDSSGLLWDADMLRVQGLQHHYEQDLGLQQPRRMSATQVSRKE